MGKWDKLAKMLWYDDDIEMYVRDSQHIDFYCAGGVILSIKNKELELFSPEYEKYLNEEHKVAVEQLRSSYKNDPDSTINALANANYPAWPAMKAAMRDRANCENVSVEKGSKSYKERAFQQIIASKHGIRGNNREWVISDFSFGIEGFGSDVDLVAVNSKNKQIAFIEYKQGTGALAGKSGITAHCKDIFSFMDMAAIKATILSRYNVLKKMKSHPGNITNAMCEFDKDYTREAQDYTSFCVFMITNIKIDEMLRAISNNIFNKYQEINDEVISHNAELYLDWTRLRFLHGETPDDITFGKNI